MPYNSEFSACVFCLRCSRCSHIPRTEGPHRSSLCRGKAGNFSFLSASISHTQIVAMALCFKFLVRLSFIRFKCPFYMCAIFAVRLSRRSCFSELPHAFGAAHTAMPRHWKRSAYLLWRSHCNLTLVLLLLVTGLLASRRLVLLISSPMCSALMVPVSEKSARSPPCASETTRAADERSEC